MKRILVIACLITHVGFGQQSIYKHGVSNQVWGLTEVMYHDVVNPPAAARFYSYSLLAGYEILCQLDNDLNCFQRRLKGFPAYQTSLNRSNVNRELASLYGILETGKNIIPSGYLLEEKQVALINSFSYLSKQVIDSSVAFAKLVSQKIVQFSKSDGYFKLSTLN